MLRSIFVLALLVLALRPAMAAECPDHPGALGTARVLAIDPATTGPVGRKQFPATLPLEPNELVLTFDDGPWPGPTERVLAALKQECVRATFFMLGRNAAAHPALAKRVAADGHTVAHHSYAHKLLNTMPLPRAEAEIDLGIAAVDAAAYGEPGAGPRTPFFRFPGFASSPALLAMLAQRGIAVFGADLWGSDWNRMSPGHQRALLMQRVAAARRGIVLLHDTQPQTAAMLPGFLRELKQRGFRIVHVEAKKP